MSRGPPLVRDLVADEPGFVGARWWQESVVDPVGERRRIFFAALAVGGAATVPLAFAADSCGPRRPTRIGALDLQRRFGWSFGAAGEPLTYNGRSTEPFDASRLSQMQADFAPRVPAYRPFYVPTLFEAPGALSREVAAGDTAPVSPLATALQPIRTSGMLQVFGWAQDGAASLAAGAPDAALVVDLDGQDAVAFAAGAVQRFDPVFLFDNWPHPRGVVPAHLTLAAAAYYQPLFAEAGRSAPRDVRPMFVLDRQRLAPYRDDANRFDNRWVARMPGAKALLSMGVRRLLYVAPHGAQRELDDLNDDFVVDHAAGLQIAILDVSALAASPPGEGYVPIARHTPFSSGVPGGLRPMPMQFGTTPVYLTQGGTVLGVPWSRSGTWNRGWGGWAGG